MGVTKLDIINATSARAKVLAASPATPMAFYGETAGQDPTGVEWAGGEIYYNSADGKLYIQTATSGRGTGTWYATQDTFVTTSTTSSSSTTSSTTSTSTTSSTTSSTSSTTSSTSSSSTSSSSTTTGA